MVKLWNLENKPQNNLKITSKKGVLSAKEQLD